MIHMRSYILKRGIATSIAVVFMSSVMFAFQNCANHDSVSKAPSEQALLFDTVSKEAKSILKTYGFPSNEIQLEENGLIVPGSPELSSLYLDFIDGIEPQGEEKLSDTELAYIRDWIALMGDLWDTVIAPPPVNGNGEPIDPGTFQYVVLAVFLPKCGSCHSAATAAARGNGVDLSSYVQVLDRVVVPDNPVSGGQPLANHILTRVQSNAGNRMPPPPGLPLIPADIDAINEWIANGGLDD